jgi:hypothetical protein
MLITITQEGTSCRLKRKLVSVVGSKIGLAHTPKCTKQGIVRCFVKELVHWGVIIDNTRWCTINKIGGCEISLIPEFYDILA